MLREFLFNKLRRNIEERIFHKTLQQLLESTHCSDKPSRDIAVRGHQDLGTGVFAPPPRSPLSLASELVTFHRAKFFFALHG